ncbi:MAG: RNA-binding S4 domain-containing protein [Prochlorococcus sp.]|jgi:ribosome-associated protein|nr:RNA-binding S4 domain-containing protein [Prochlorococcaceae cyanobacterium ETNP18_MAG_14]HJM80238.1 RNA-binding S4 domain-containing protein [Prochlorococcaceae cyanobacterium Fu_MAG_72]
MKLDQFLKCQGWVATGGEAKHLIQSGHVCVNGCVETRRGHHLKPGDLVRLGTDEASFVAIDSIGP